MCHNDDLPLLSRRLQSRSLAIHNHWSLVVELSTLLCILLIIAKWTRVWFHDPETFLNFNMQIGAFCGAFRQRTRIHQFTNWS